VRAIDETDTPLSKREEEVYGLLLEGKTNKAIARSLYISEVTVKAHLRHVFEKLGVHTRAEAIARAHDADLGG
jgi:DNA-binding NarL/FixJ family response regulator